VIEIAPPPMDWHSDRGFAPRLEFRSSIAVQSSTPLDPTSPAAPHYSDESHRIKMDPFGGAEGHPPFP